MENINLCFGTFASLLNKFRISDTSQVDFIASLVSGIDEDSRYKDEAAAVTRLLKCEIDYKLSKKAKEANEPSYRTVKKHISNEVAPHIKEDGKKIIILALLDIIRKDKSLEQQNRELFEDFFGLYKDELLQESKFEFSDIVCKALLYTTYGGVQNKYDRGDVFVISDDYINDVTSPYLSDVDWDVENQTLNLTYIDYYNTFKQVIEEYEMDCFIEKVDPTNGFNFVWFDKFEGLRETASQGKYHVKDASEMGKKILLYCRRLQNYMDYLSYYVSIETYENEDGTGTTSFCNPAISIVPNFRMEALMMRKELSSIYEEMTIYAFPHKKEEIMNRRRA